MSEPTMRTLADLLCHADRCFGEKVFLRELQGKEIVETSYAQLLQDSQKVSRFLEQISGGDRIHAAVIGTTSAAYLTSYFGTACAGHVIVPLDAQLSADTLCDLLQRADVEVFFYDRRFAAVLPAVQEYCSGIHTFVPLQEDPAQPEALSLPQILRDYTPLSWESVDPDSCAAILYTSGTTGKAKGVMLSHGNFLDNTMCQENESSPADTLLTVLPIHHVYCFTCDILLSLRYGATVCVNDSIMHIAQNLKRFQPTLILLVPMIAETIYKKIRAAAESTPGASIQAIAGAVFGGKLRGIYSGGAYLQPELIQAYRELGIPIAQGYGMTECAPRIATANLEDESVGDIGTIVNGCQVRIVDGEIWAKSPSVMMGYYKDPAATAEALTEDGWLRTGDLGYVDEKRHLFMTGRKKNLIILSNGENVSPEELENQFAGVDWAAEVLVYAEEEILTAEIFPAEEIYGTMSDQEIQALCLEQVQKINRKVPSAKAIHRIRIRKMPFEKTASGKIRREQKEKGELCTER